MRACHFHLQVDYTEPDATGSKWPNARRRSQRTQRFSVMRSYAREFNYPEVSVDIPQCIQHGKFNLALWLDDQLDSDHRHEEMLGRVESRAYPPSTQHDRQRESAGRNYGHHANDHECYFTLAWRLHLATPVLT